MTFLVFVLTLGAAHWLIARSTAFRFFWSRARGLWDELLRCPACCGWWLGAIAWFVGLRPIRLDHAGVEFIVTGLLGIATTPIGEGVLLWALGITAIERDESTNDVDQSSSSSNAP